MLEANGSVLWTRFGGVALARCRECRVSCYHGPVGAPPCCCARLNAAHRTDVPPPPPLATPNEMHANRSVPLLYNIVFVQLTYFCRNVPQIFRFDVPISILFRFQRKYKQLVTLMHSDGTIFHCRPINHDRVRRNSCTYP